jgi:undecaprenyl diphosphate synthase
LSTSAGPEPDLIVRTSGEQRISNFLLGRRPTPSSCFQDVLWPDYGPEHLADAMSEFMTRERRFGASEVHDVLAAG